MFRYKNTIITEFYFIIFTYLKPLKSIEFYKFVTFLMRVLSTNADGLVDAVLGFYTMSMDSQRDVYGELHSWLHRYRSQEKLTTFT